LPFAANVSEVRGDELTRIRWGGTLLEEARLHTDRRLMTAAPFAFEASTGPVHPQALSPSLDGAVAVVDHVAPDTGGKVSLADAKVVVSGGRGVGSAEGFGILEELASLLDAAVGCSRVVTSAGWRPHSDQVGQTGTKVSPDLYIACGISGATQHIAGCKGAKTVLAINADREATIFAHADYAVIGDLHEIVPAITAELRKVKG
jgi:electron transfer flavoprotein alpha subunit